MWTQVLLIIGQALGFPFPQTMTVRYFERVGTESAHVCVFALATYISSINSNDAMNDDCDDRDYVKGRWQLAS